MFKRDYRCNKCKSIFKWKNRGKHEYDGIIHDCCPECNHMNRHTGNWYERVGRSEQFIRGTQTTG